MSEANKTPESRPLSAATVKRLLGLAENRGLHPIRWLAIAGLVLVVGVVWVWVSAKWGDSEVSEAGRAAAQEYAGKGPSAVGAPEGPTVSSDGTQVTLNAQHMLNVAVGPVETVEFRENKEAIGQVAYNEDHSTPIFSNYSGRVASLTAKPGDEVERGTVLFELDSTDLVNAESAFISAGSALRAAKSHLELTRRAAERAKLLFEAKAIAQRDFDQAQDDYQAAQSTEAAAIGSIAAARNTLRLYGKSDAFIDQLQATRHVDSILPIKSPISGTVVMRKVGPGQYVQPDGQNPLFVVADLSTMWLRLNVAESDAVFVRPGQQVEVRISALPGRVFKAKVVHVNAAIDPASRRVTVRAEIPNPERVLKPEMFATATVFASKGSESLAVPLDGVIRNGPAANVWVETAAAQFTLRAVKIGLEQNGFAQILDGLQPGDRVVSRGAIFLSNARTVAKK